MLLRHLHEGATDTKKSRDILDGLMKSLLIKSILGGLREIEDDGHAAFVADMLQKAAGTEQPELILDLIDELMDLDGKLPPQFRGTIGTMLDRVAEAAQADEKLFKELVKKVDVPRMVTKLDRTNGAALKLAYDRLTRTPKQKKFDREYDSFVFIGRTAFKEDPPGSDSFKKTLEIERLVPVDRFDINAHKMIGMMKIRAVYQGGDSRVYKVDLPKGAVDPDGDIPAYLVDLINKHKTEVTN